MANLRGARKQMTRRTLLESGLELFSTPCSMKVASLGTVEVRTRRVVCGARSAGSR
ncbi:hypothetical protein GCM10018771_30150 [Streptomyces cellulosae]|nr:hypothetical protein GCM10018771_30150 [Streptomyces cellulosae]